MRFRQLDAKTAPRLAAAVDVEQALRYYTIGWESSGRVPSSRAASLWTAVLRVYCQPLVLLLEQDGSMALLGLWSTSDTWLASRGSRGGS